MSMHLNGRKVVNVTVDGVNCKDYPDFSDSHFDDGYWEDDGEQLSNHELEQLLDYYPDVANEMAHERYH